MPVIGRYSARSLVKGLRQMLTGMFKANILRKSRGSGDGIDVGWTVSAVYTNLDCDIQNVTRKDLEGIQTAMAGNLLLLLKIGYFPRFVKEEQNYSEIFILPDDQVHMLSTTGEQYAVKRVDTYEDHLELLLEPLNQ